MSAVEKFIESAENYLNKVGELLDKEISKEELDPTNIDRNLEIIKKGMEAAKLMKEPRKKTKSETPSGSFLDRKADQTRNNVSENEA